MDGFRTVGQPAALAAVGAMLRTGMPHAVLLTGPSGVGKATLALDIAAALLCTAEDSAIHPCRVCRTCRMVDHGNHPDLHRLAPSGAGSSIPIGGRGERGVRDLVGDLSLLPVEGGQRVAILEGADRMSEDAQSAFLKTLEEPPARTTIILSAADEERLLPTIRSRCARVRLGPMGIRDVEAILVGHGVADAPTAARLARMTDGRPGHAIAYALAPSAATIRAEIARTLLDLLGSGVGARLTGVRDLATRAAELVRELDAGAARADLGPGAEIGTRGGSRGRGAARATGAKGGRGRMSATVAPTAGTGAGTGSTDAASDTDSPETVPGEPPARVPAAERRRGALALVGIWRSTLRDLALVGRGAPTAVRDVDLLDDLERSAAAFPPEAAGRFLHALDVAGERLEGNVSPELVLDVLALHWARSAQAA